MTGFSIDDVKETIGKDITELLGRIEETATSFADVALRLHADEATTRAFQLISDTGHAIYGTSSLVEATSLSTSARVIERLADRGNRELLLAKEHAERAREIAIAVRNGVSEMRSMLSLELGHRADEAEWLALEWQGRANDLLGPAVQPSTRAEELVEQFDEAGLFTVEEVSTSGKAFSFEPVADPVALEDELSEIFRQEARESVIELQRQLGSLRKSRDDLGAARQLERLFHTLKGAAATVGLADVAAIASTLQKQLVAVVDSGAPVTDELLAELGSGTVKLLEAAGLADLAQTFHQEPEAEPEPAPTQPGHNRHKVALPNPELWQVFAQECSELLETLDGAILALESSARPKDDIRALLPTYHTLKGVVNTIGLNPTGAALHQVESLLEGLVQRGSLPPINEITTLLLKVQAEVRRHLGEARQGYVEFSLPRFEALVAKVAESTAPASTRSSRASARSSSSTDLERAGETDTRKYVRVGTDRLDALMNLAGELVVSRSRLMLRVGALRTMQTELGRGGRRLIETVEHFCDAHEFAGMDARAQLAMAAGSEGRDGAWSAFSELELDRYEDIHVLSRSLSELTSDFDEVYTRLSEGLSALTDDSDAFSGIIGGIQSEVTRARMVPLELLFSRLRLPVRDAAMREGKVVRLVTSGEDVHLDKTIADALFQPMVHLVRNAVAHGIESAEARLQALKPEAGAIELHARQEQGQIVLEIRDDGAGLDRAKLRAQGIALGLIDESVTVDDPRILELVFAPGLSTEATARAVAGRGLGCDVVRRTVERLNGSIRVETEAGAGARFILTLPLTLAMTRALLVSQGGQSFAVPLYFADRILDAQEQDIVDSAGVRRVLIDESFAPIVHLASFFGAPADEAPRGPIVVLRVGTERVVVQVDAVLGQEEIVVKSLGAVLTGHPLFAGVTIRGTGEMVLILDVPALADSRRSAARPRVPANDTGALVRAKNPAPRPALEARAKIRVLFVDDSLSVRKVAEKALLAAKVEVTLAVDGVDALAKLRQDHFDMVFTDLEMPRMHGFELIRELRFLDAYRALPIVVVTSRSGQKHKDQAESLGATEYLTKPFTARSLEAAVQKWGRARHPKAGSS